MSADVAIIIPTYMRPRRTLRAVRSGLRQRGVHPEVVVIDDGSPVPFVLPAEFADAGVRLVRLAVNGGPAAARNAGVAATSAPVIAFLDSDDFFLPDSLSPRLTAFEKSAKSGQPLLFASPVWRWVPGRSAHQYRPIEASSVETFAGGCWYFPGSTSIFARSTWDRIGPLDTGMRRLEDYEWSLRLALAGGVLRVAPQTAVVIERASRAGLEKVNPAIALLLKRYGPGGNHALDGQALVRLRAYLALEKASSALGAGHYPSLASSLVSSFLHQPRLSLHLSDWWTSKIGSGEELGEIEDIAHSLSH
jgi:glycosyltransferase involved in cell wall biosynthesis